MATALPTEQAEWLTTEEADVRSGVISEEDSPCADPIGEKQRRANALAFARSMGLG